MPGESTIADLIPLCLESDSGAAWREFVARTQPVIASVIFRLVRRYSKPDPSLIDDIVQDTYLRLCRNGYRALRDFKEQHDDAIFGFLKAVAASVATDHFRSAKAQKRFADNPPSQEEVTESAASVPANAEQVAMVREVNERLDQLAGSSRDKVIFWLYYQHGYSARDIAALPEVGLSAKGVESCIYRLTHALRSFVMRPRGSTSLAEKGNVPSSTLGDIG